MKPLDRPNAPGWWAFEGRFNEPGATDFRYVIEVVDVEGELVAIVSGDFEFVDALVGKWWKLKVPWEGSQ